MKQTIKQISLTAGVLLSLWGCGNFLEQRSQNMAYLENIEDLDELLIGECYLPKGTSYTLETSDVGVSNWSRIVNDGSPNFPAIHLLDDDAAEYLYTPSTTESNYARLRMSQLHYWQRDPFRDSEYKEIKDGNWAATYRRIAVINTILNEVEGFRETNTPELYNRIKGEALFLRAQHYFWLANLYARPYCKRTAAVDESVPLKTTDPIEDRFFARSPMQEVWNQMAKDLKEAAAALRNTGRESVFRASRAAACALLSRVSLYMEDYENAVAYADSILLTEDYRLLDFNQQQAKQSALYASSPETIFTQGPNIMAILHGAIVNTAAVWLPPVYQAAGYTTSGDLMACYDEQDLRLTAFFTERPTPGSGFRCLKWRESTTDEEISDYMAIRLSEVYLNKAEALAILGRGEEAKTVLQELRANRFPTGALPEIEEEGSELVRFVRDERRRELCYEGHRWFDLRRYAVNTEYPFMKQIVHESLIYSKEGTGPEGAVQGRYILDTYDKDGAAWMLPIPRDEIEFNAGMLTNETRNERSIVTQ